MVKSTGQVRSSGQVARQRPEVEREQVLGELVREDVLGAVPRIQATGEAPASTRSAG